MAEAEARLLEDILAGRRLAAEEAFALAEGAALPALMAAAAALRDRGHGRIVSYSRKVFIPLTRLCRDVCHYCTFAQAPQRGRSTFLTREEVLAIARAGVAAGCKEALFTLGDKPELRYAAAREELDALGHASTISYLVEMAAHVFAETGLLPHANPGLLTAPDIAALRAVTVSQGLMLETSAERLSERGGPHFGSPDKHPALRLETIRLAGEAAVPFTSGLLIGIGETRRERIEALLALRELHERYDHLQEIIVQNFRAKPATRMAAAADAPQAEHLRTIAMARLVLGAAMNIQAPPNLSPEALAGLVGAGINDWGGVSPVTPDHVNPEAPWPQLSALERATNAAGKELVERLAIYPEYVLEPQRWLDPGLATAVLRRIDADGFARMDDWSPGADSPVPERECRLIAAPRPAALEGDLAGTLARAQRGETLAEAEIVRLFSARGPEFGAVCAAADELRQDVNGDRVSYVVNRNINYTNVCYYRCQFCAFSKGKLSENLRGRPYALDLDEIMRRTREAWARGASEVCMQGGIHPEYTGATYLDICRAVKTAAPGIHVHAFTPLEVSQGAATLGQSVPDFLAALRAAGLGTLPGTAAEILDDEVRAVICPDKVTSDEWLAVMAAAHALGIRSTATIMFGHVERPLHWARHLLRVRALQMRTRGFSEFIPLPFVHMEAPIYLKGRARRGPSFREAVLMHAVARLALHPHIPNIQASWVKMGPEGVAACLKAGVNDLGGTLMNETITRSAGAVHGQEMSPAALEAMIRAAGRTPVQRTTLYREAGPERRDASLAAAPLADVVNTPARRYERAASPGPLAPPIVL